MSDVKITFSAETNAATAAIERFTNGVQSRLSGMLTSFLAGFSVNAVRNWIDNQIEAADQAGKTAQKIGLSTESFSAYAYAAKLANVEQGEFMIGMKTLAQQVVDAARGQDLAAGAFQRLSVQFQNADGTLRTLDEMLPEIANGFAAMPDGITKSDLAVQLFGRSGLNLIPLLNEGAAGLARFREEAAKLGIIISAQTAQAADEFKDNLTRLHTVTQGYALSIAEQLLPSLVAFTDNLVKNTAAARDNENAIGRLATAIKIFATAALQLYYGFKTIFGFIETAIAHAIAGWQIFYDTIKESVAGWANVFSQGLSSLKALGPAFSALGKALMKELLGGNSDAEWAEFKLRLIEATEGWIKGVKGNNPLSAALDGVQTMFGTFKGLWSDWWDSLDEDADEWQKKWDAIWHPPMLALTDKPNPNRDTEDSLVKPTKDALAEIVRAYEEAFFDKQQLLTAEHTRALEELSKSATDYQQFLDGKALLDEIYAKKSADLAVETRRKILEISRSAIDNEIAAAQGNLFLTQSQRDARISPLLRNRLSLNAGAQASEQAALSGSSTEEARMAAQQRLNELKSEEISLTQQLQALDHSFGATLQANITRLYDSWSNIGKNLIETTFAGIQSAVQGVGDAVAGLIDGTTNWGKTWIQVTKQVISQMTQVLAQYIANKLAMMAVDAIASQMTKKNQKQEAASGALAGLGKAAEEGGWWGVLVYAVVYAAAIAAVMAAVAGATGGFAEGGRVPGGEQMIRVNEKGEETVMTARATAMYGPLLDRMNAGDLEAVYAGFAAARRSGPRVRPITSSAESLDRDAPGLRSGGVTPHVTVQGHKMETAIVMLRDENELRRYLESNAGKRIIFQHVKDGKAELGFET